VAERDVQQKNAQAFVTELCAKGCCVVPSNGIRLSLLPLAD